MGLGASLLGWNGTTTLPPTPEVGSSWRRFRIAEPLGGVRSGRFEAWEVWGLEGLRPGRVEMSMERTTSFFSFGRRASDVVGSCLLALTLACGGGTVPEASERSATVEPDAEGAAVEDLPERDVTGIDVCATIPAEALAQAMGLPVVEPAVRMPEDPAPNCTYRLRGSSGSGERVDIYLKDPFDYDWARQTAESFGREVREIDDLGVSAYAKETPDYWPEVWARRADGLVVHVIAWEEQASLTAARVALERVP